MLRFRIRMRQRKMSSLEGLGSGPEGRLKRLRKHMTALIRHERIETTYAQCDETRGYAEKLISMAVRNGDTHKHTMEMADYWLLEKDLIHKLFKVLVPRYKSLPAAVTSIHQISGTYPGRGHPFGVLELKGNPWPSVQPRPHDTRLHLHNIQLEEARKDYRKQRSRPTSSATAKSSAAATSATSSSASTSSAAATSSATATSATADGVGDEGSSVDGPPAGSRDEDSSHTALDGVAEDRGPKR